MRFLFDCEDVVCLPMAYKLVDEIKPFIDKVKDIEIDENTAKDRKTVMKKVLENVMVKYPAETGELLSKLWVLEEIEVPAGIDENGVLIFKKELEKAPNTFKTLATFFSNEVAIDFFTSVLPSLLQLSKSISPLLK